MEIVWIDPILLIPVAVFALTAGIGIALASCIAHDKRKARRIKHMVLSSDSWCEQNCRCFAEAYNDCRNCDAAWEHIKESCINCPMGLAVEEWEEQEKRNGAS